MKGALSILFLFTLSIFYKVDAQTNVYHPFPEDSATWVVDYFAMPPACNGSGYCSTSIYWLNGDTTINTLSYNKMYLEEYYDQGPYSYIMNPLHYIGGLRQDVISKKVFFISDTMNSDTLLYDLDVSIGDTLPETYLANLYINQPVVVQSIDSVMVGSLYRRRFNFATPSTNEFIIEGVGASAGPFILNNFFENGPYLRCFSGDSGALGLGYSNCGFNMGVMNPKATNENLELQILPNPTIGTVKIISSQKIHSIVLTNSLGERISLVNQSNSQFELDLSSFSKGIYFVKVTDEKGNFGVKKIVLQ